MLNQFSRKFRETAVQNLSFIKIETPILIEMLK